MNVIKIVQGEVQDVEFRIEVEGGSVEDVRLCVDEGKVVYCWRGERKDSDVYRFGVDLSQVKLREGELSCFLEVFVAGKRFVPFSGKVLVERRVDVKAEIATKDVVSTVVNEVKVKLVDREGERLRGSSVRKGADVVHESRSKMKYLKE